MEQYNRNNINILLEHSAKTPRMSVNFFFRINKKEKYYGINSLLARLLLQGTKKYSAEVLAQEFENECIDISTKAKQDYLKIAVNFLNEDFYYAMELVKDLILNSTFDEYQKEIHKIKGEIVSDLDNPKMKLTDCFVRNIFKEHPYSTTHTKILEDIDRITKEDILEAHRELFNCNKSIVLVGDFANKEEKLKYFEDNFDFMCSKENYDDVLDVFELKENETIYLVKENVSQAQILQGTLIDSFNSSNCAKIAVLNNILGSCGLSSRLFVNLRDKKGLAYNVRSQYDTMFHSAIFNMYIGTAPKNIKLALEGFKDELQKLAETAPGIDELKGAKENISGRLKYFTQNNSQIAAVVGYNHIMGLGIDYNNLFMDDVNNVCAQDVSNMAKSILETPKLTVIIGPEEYKI